MAERNLGFEAQIIVNDLDSLNMRIEQLQAHPRYTDAQMFVQNAKRAMTEGMVEVHQREMRERFAKTDAASGPSFTRGMSENGVG